MTTTVSAVRLTEAQCATLAHRAHEAGLAAGEAARPRPMVVVQRADPFDDTSPVVRQYAPVEGGVCGFAYVKVRPGNSAFARYMKAHLHGYKAYYGGVEFSVYEFGQSLERKAAYAYAYVEVLREAGLAAYPETRVD